MPGENAMAEELQSLLDRIQKDGVDKAQAEAARIVAAAEARATALLKDADTKATALRQQAERDSAAFAERGKVALQQASRDIILSLAAAINRTLQGLVSTDVTKALDPQTLGRMIEQVASAYVQSSAGQQRVEVLLAPAQQQAVIDYGKTRLADALRRGLDIKGDGRVLAGFRVSVDQGHVQHDFTEPAITEALCELLRPHIAGLVRDAAKSA
jgi:V/A-type H+-transporting ATPase subunit E